jgi:molybdopterin synthase catalytic subunit
MSIFIQNGLPATLLAGFTRQYSENLSTGAYSCFMGQVRADEVNGRKVIAIEYTAYTEMADAKMTEIAEEVAKQYNLSGLEIRHSLGKVMAGETCLFVLAMAAHRKPAMEACNLLVERLKSELPVWGKELFAEEDYQWKINQ